MYPVDFPARFEIAQKKRKGDINCISAAHYLSGITDEEEYILTSLTNVSYIDMRFIKVGSTRGLPLSIPDKAVAFGFTGDEYSNYWHMGIISPYNRSEIIQRPAWGTPIEVTTFEAVIKGIYNTTGLKIDFLTPNPDWFYSR